MKIKKLKLKNFRNYEFLDLNFDDNTNIFYGSNAQGKTNILEAVYLSSTTKSHRGTKDKDMINFEKEECHIDVVIEKDDCPFQIDMHLKKNSSKGIAINKIPIKKASELFGIINVIFFSPEDLNIIKNGPAERRKFIDFELSQLDKVYLSDLTNYNRVLNQRNKLLKDVYDRKELLDMLEVWDLQLINFGNKIIERRKLFIEQVNKIISNIHFKLTGGKENLSIFYELGTGNCDFETALEKNREKDIRFKSTSVGPHRDDICFISNNIDVRKFGSQGQQRTTALSLKLSEIELVKKTMKDTPILLLDDVLSELDNDRQNYLLESIKGIQTLITCTGMEEFISNHFSVNKLFYVENGNVTAKN